MSALWSEQDGQQTSQRRQNLSRLLREIHVSGPLSRSDLAARMSVNRSTVGSLVAELTERGLVCEHAPEARVAPGRPSPVVEPRRDGPVVLATEIATDSLAAALVGLGGVMLHATRIDRSRAGHTPEEAVDELAALATSLVRQLPGRDGIVAVGVSVPGLVRHEDGFVHIAPNLDWRDVPLTTLIAERLELGVPVGAGNDADLAGLAEHIRGAGVGCSDFICLWGEAGVGAGIVVDGRPLTGCAGYAGEVGHVPVNPAGISCHCGSRGCWETEVGEDALLRNAGMRGSSGGRPALEELFAAADRRDPSALAAIETVGNWLGVGLVGLVNLFNPSAIAFGALYGRLFPYVREIVTDIVGRRAMPAPRSIVEIVPAALGPDSALLGAAELAFAPLLRDPTTVRQQ